MELFPSYQVNDQVYRYDTWTVEVAVAGMVIVNGRRKKRGGTGGASASVRPKLVLKFNGNTTTKHQSRKTVRYDAILLK